MTVTLPASDLGSSATLVGVLNPVAGDKFVSRVQLQVPDYIPAADVALASLETSEPNANASTKTLWYEIPVSGLTKLRVAVTGTGGKVAIYHQMVEYLEASQTPSVTSLLQVGAGTDVIVDIDDTFDSYYIQLGGTAASTTLALTIEDAAPADGGTFGTAIPTYDDWGYEQVDTTNSPTETGEPIPAGITPTGSGWLQWEAPEVVSDPTSFDVASVGDLGTIGLAVYTGTALNALTEVTSDVAPATDGVSVSFSPAAGALYWVQVTSTDARNTYAVTWSGSSELMIPEEHSDFLRVEVYERDGVTKISEVIRRVGCKGIEVLNAPGNGGLSIPLRDEIFDAYPDLLDTNNVVKFWIGAKCISAIRITKVETTIVSQGEYSGQAVTATGPTVHFMMNDFVVHHDGDPRPDSLEVRYYSWASRPGEWFDKDKWDDHVNANTQANPPGDWKKIATKRSKYGMPKKWPDKESMWIWISQDPSRNEGNWAPRRPIKGHRYYRHNVVTENADYRLFVTSDETARVYIDGEEVMRHEGQEDGYKDFTKLDVSMGRGSHTIAIYVRSHKSRKGDSVDALMFSMYKLNKKGEKERVVLRSNRSWLAYYGEQPPGWNRAYVLRSAVREARDRGNDTANLLVFDFDGARDTDNRKWTDRFNQEVHVGASSVELQSQLSEGNGFDVWVKPDNFRLRAYRRRGQDKSQSIALIPGVNLLDWSVTEEDEIGNIFLIRYDGGFTKVKAPASKKRTGDREVYLELGGVKEGATARKIVQNIIRNYGDYRKRGKHPEVSLKRDVGREGSVIGIDGAYPFVDWTVGDTIAAPSGRGGALLVPMRCMSLAFSESPDGNLSFDPELEQVGDAIRPANGGA